MATNHIPNLNASTILLYTYGPDNIHYDIVFADVCGDYYLCFVDPMDSSCIEKFGPLEFSVEKYPADRSVGIMEDTYEVDVADQSSMQHLLKFDLRLIDLGISEKYTKLINDQIWSFIERHMTIDRE